VKLAISYYGKNRLMVFENNDTRRQRKRYERGDDFGGIWYLKLLT
jgi:hypothetical protein